MNLSDHVNLHQMFWPTQKCKEALEIIEKLHPARFLKRTKMDYYRATGEELECSYNVALNAALGKEALKQLTDMAPEFEGSRLAEVVVNKYEPSDYMPDHMDKTTYTHNVLINLQTSNEDGIQIEDTHYPDEEGRAVIFKKLGVRHSVPPVKNLRYTLIYLYERG